MNKELIVYGASDDLVEFSGVITQEWDTYGPWYGVIRDGDEELQLHVEFGVSASGGWLIRANNPHNWVIVVGERPGREEDPAFYITLPTGNVEIEELEDFSGEFVSDISSE